MTKKQEWLHKSKIRRRKFQMKAEENSQKQYSLKYHNEDQPLKVIPISKNVG